MERIMKSDAERLNRLKNRTEVQNKVKDSLANESANEAYKLAVKTGKDVKQYSRELNLYLVLGFIAIALILAGIYQIQTLNHNHYFQVAGWTDAVILIVVLINNPLRFVKKNAPSIGLAIILALL